MNEVQKCTHISYPFIEFNSTIPRFINATIQIIYLKVITEVYPNLFTIKWLNDNSRSLITNVKNTITV